MHEPPLTKSCTNIKQFLKQPLQLSYPNHTQAVERGVKLTTKATSRIAGQKRQICEALCSLAARKKKSDGWENPGELQEDLLNNDSVPRFAHCVLCALHVHPS